jgi:hypothetical protein
MELKTAIEILEYYQQWRLGKREDMIHEPKKLTEALDMVILEVKKNSVSGWASVTDALIDGDGQVLHEGDRVFTHSFTDNGWGRHYGTLHRNTEFPEVSDWCIHYDDREQFAVLDFADVFKA